MSKTYNYNSLDANDIEELKDVLAALVRVQGHYFNYNDWFNGKPNDIVDRLDYIKAEINSLIHDYEAV